MPHVGLHIAQRGHGLVKYFLVVVGIDTIDVGEVAIERKLMNYITHNLEVAVLKLCDFDGLINAKNSLSIFSYSVGHGLNVATIPGSGARAQGLRIDNGDIEIRALPYKGVCHGRCGDSRSDDEDINSPGWPW